MLLSPKSGSVLYYLWIWYVSVLDYPRNHVNATELNESSPENGVSSPVILACSESVTKDFEESQRMDDSQREQGGGAKAVRWKVPHFLVSSNQSIHLSLVVGEPYCKKSATTRLKLKWEGAAFPDSKTIHFYANGYFRNSTNIYPPDEYCIERIYIAKSSEESETINSTGVDMQSTDKENTIIVRFCKPDCGFGKERPCIKKCCPLDKIMRITKSPGCTNLPEGSIPFMPSFYEDIYTKVKSSPTSYFHSGGLQQSQPERLMPHFILNHPKYFQSNCSGKVPIIVSPTSNTSVAALTQRTGQNYQFIQFRLRSDGAIIYKSLENKCNVMSMKREFFCIDGLRGALSFEEDESQVPYTNTEEEYILFECPEEDSNHDPYVAFIFGLLLVTTSIFPLITSLVYGLLWKKQNIHGWTIAATSASLFFMYIFQGTAHLLSITLKTDALNTFGCRAIAILLHFFMMSTFTWCSVMTFDLFITFRSVVPMNQRLQGVSRYVKYSLFGWGIPGVVVVISVFIDFVFTASNDCSFHAVPGYGQTNCWIVESSLGEYLYYPAGFLLCVNILLFTATCVKLCMYGKGSAARARKNNDAFGECSFSRFSKLFCVMGISWIFEILSWLVDGLGSNWKWFVFDLFNILRAVGIFAIYVCKEDVLKQLGDSYPFMKQIVRPFERFFTRKCSEQYAQSTAESTVLSTGPVSNSPAVAMAKLRRKDGGSRSSQQNGKRISQGSCASCEV